MPSDWQQSPLVVGGAASYDDVGGMVGVGGTGQLERILTVCLCKLMSPETVIRIRRRR